MNERQQFEVWRTDIQPALISKVDELHLLGYDRANEEDVWTCVLYQLRKKKEFMHKHAFVNSVLTLKPQTFMTWLTIHSYKEPTDWFTDFESGIQR